MKNQIKKAASIGRRSTPALNNHFAFGSIAERTGLENEEACTPFCLQIVS